MRNRRVNVNAQVDCAVGLDLDPLGTPCTATRSLTLARQAPMSLGVGPIRVGTSRFRKSGIALIICLLASGCASTQIHDSNEAVEVREKAVDIAYLNELNKHVVSIFTELGAKADASRDANLSYGWQRNPYVNIALSAATHYDLINRKSFFPIWKSINKFAHAQLARLVKSPTAPDAQTIERFYQNHPAAAAAVVEHMASAFLRHNIFVNRFVTPSAPIFLLPLTQQAISPGPQATAALNDLFGSSIDPAAISLRVIDGSDTASIPFAGVTAGSLAVVNEPVVRSVARELATTTDDVREVIVANESVHVYLDGRFGSITDRKWPMDRLAEFMQPPFDLKPVHVEEFLSDVVSIRTNDVGLQFAYLGLFLNAVHVDESGQSVGAASSRYGYSAEFFLRAFEKAEIEAGLPQAERQAHILRQATAMADKRAGANLVAQRPDPRVLNSIKESYLEMGRRIFETID